MTAFLPLALVLGLSMVEGESTCPDPAAVEAELLSMLGTLDGLEETVRLMPGPDNGVVVEMRNARGEIVVIRSIEGNIACADRAQVAAVFAAVMLNEVHPELVVAWPAPAAQAPPPTPPPAQPKNPTDLVARAPAPAPDRKGHGVDLGAGLSATLAGGDPQLGAQAQANFLPGRTGIGVHLGVAVDMERDTTISSSAGPIGTFSWRRIPVAAGPVLRIALRDWNLDVRGTIVGSWLLARGNDFNGYESQSVSSFNLGAGAGVRATTRTGPLIKWLDVSGTLEPQQSGRLDDPGVSDQLQPAARLPMWHILLTLGASWCPAC